MEQLIKKKQKKDARKTGMSAVSTNTVNSDDPFEEFNRWFKSRRLEREACPNPIAWWGICTFVPSVVFTTKCFASINSNTLSFG